MKRVLIGLLSFGTLSCFAIDKAYSMTIRTYECKTADKYTGIYKLKFYYENSSLGLFPFYIEADDDGFNKSIIETSGEDTINLSAKNSNSKLLVRYSDVSLNRETIKDVTVKSKRNKTEDLKGENCFQTSEIKI